MSASQIAARVIPEYAGDLAAFEDAVAGIGVDGARLRDAGVDLVAGWRGLAEFYQTPDSAHLLSVITPVRTSSQAVADDLAAVGRALRDYAEEVRPVAASLASLRSQAEEFDARTAGDGNWNHDQANVDENNRLLRGVNSAVVLLEAAERRCANAIEALFSCRRWHASVGVAADQDAYGYASIPDGAPTPWGSVVARKDSCPKAAVTDLGRFAKGFAIDGFVGTLSSVASLLNPFDWKKFKESWEGLAQLSVALSPILGASMYGGVGERERLVSLGKGLISYDMWRSDPSRASGEAVFNVASLLVPGGGEVGAAADGAKVARIAGEAADAAKGADNVAKASEIATSVEATGRLASGSVSGIEFVSLPTVDQLSDLIMARRAAQLGMKAPTTAELSALMEKLAHAKPGELTVDHTHVPVMGGHEPHFSHLSGDHVVSEPVQDTASATHDTPHFPEAPPSQFPEPVERLPDAEFAELPDQAKSELALREISPGAVHFVTNEAGATYGKAHWGEFVRALPQEERNALTFYTHQPPHRLTSVDINSYLRGLEEPKVGVPTAIERIDSALARSEVTEPIIVSRGMRLEHLEAEPGELEGDVLTEEGFTSASLGMPAFSFSQAVLHLRLPVGTHAVYIDGISAFGGEREILIRRGISYRVTRAFMDRNQQWQIYGEVVPNG
ncbi:ADP-ribosyltransferase exoenzyme [Frankineae bacterium MT45]|nr:ADP-ribosyltransferase exoenzyme [Frankineae bacterium MT45]